MTRVTLALALLLGGCAASGPRIARIQTSLGEPRELTVYVQHAGEERALRLEAEEGVEVVEARLDGDAIQIRWKRAGLCPMSDLRVPVSELEARYVLESEGTCAIVGD